MNPLEPYADFLDERRFAVLATVNPDGSPHLSVMWYVRNGDQIVMNTLAGRRKHRNIKDDRRVSLCIEDEARYLTLSGTAVLDDDPTNGQKSVREIAIRYDGVEEAEKTIEEVFSKQHRVTITVLVEGIDAHGF